MAQAQEQAYVSCVTATISTTEGATDATLQFDVIDARAAERGISKGALAELAGVDPSTMWRYRQGMRPTSPVIKRLEQALGLSFAEMTERGTPTSPPPAGPSTPKPPAGPKAA